MVWTSIEGLASSHKVWHLVLAEAALLCQTSVILRNSMLVLSGMKFRVLDRPSPRPPLALLMVLLLYLCVASCKDSLMSVSGPDIV